jgi:hypothetical protein
MLSAARIFSTSSTVSAITVRSAATPSASPGLESRAGGAAI